MKKIILCSIGGGIVILGICAAAYVYTGDKIEYGKPTKVAYVIDGDTIILANEKHLRYIGVDTPEEVDPRKPVQCFAREAAARNKELVYGKSILFYKDVSIRDQYGRLLGFVYDGSGTLINEELVREGYAFAYSFPPDISKSDEFKAAEADARDHHRGLWGVCAVHRTSSGRAQTNTVEYNH
jgi:micrococcal nuclease